MDMMCRQAFEKLKLSGCTNLERRGQFSPRECCEYSMQQLTLHISLVWKTNFTSTKPFPCNHYESFTKQVNTNGKFVGQIYKSSEIQQRGHFLVHKNPQFQKQAKSRAIMALAECKNSLMIMALHLIYFIYICHINKKSLSNYFVRTQPRCE